jgi:hypothetical protein
MAADMNLRHFTRKQQKAKLTAPSGQFRATNITLFWFRRKPITKQ